MRNIKGDITWEIGVLTKDYADCRSSTFSSSTKKCVLGILGQTESLSEQQYAATLDYDATSTTRI